MYCTECGAQNPETNQFCNSCGKPLQKHQPPAPAAAAAPVAAAPPVPAPAPQAPAGAPPAAAAAPKTRRNWLGWISLVPGVLAWGVMTTILGIVAFLLGAVSLVMFRKAAGRIGISSIVSIILGLGAIAAMIMLS